MNQDRSTTAHPDLEALRRTDPEPVAAPRRPWLPRLTAAVILLGILAAAFAVLRPVLFPPRHVTLAAVRAAEGESGPRTNAFVQAAGWIEADPYPVSVRPLVSGVVESLHVVEGSPVTKDDTVVALLRNADIENALIVAQAELTRRQAVHGHRTAVHEVAISLYAQKIDLRTLVAARQGELATVRAKVDQARARSKTGEAQLAEARVELEAQEGLVQAGHATPTAMALAKARADAAEQRVTELRFEEVSVVAELGRISSLLDLAREALNDPRALQGAVDESGAAAAAAAADVERARADLEVAKRNVDLLTLKAPMTGIVLRLESAPGAMVGPGGEFKGLGEGVGSTGLLNRLTGTVCSLYDPAKLQVRVDVPYSDLPGIARGTRVEIEAKAIPRKRFQGVVDRLVREADITQAKLQVKVRVTDPDPRLRPEMLCTARFAVEAAGDDAAALTKRAVVHRLLVPTAGIKGDAVFVYDPTGGGRARRVTVRVVRRGQDWTEVEGSLGMSSKVILDDVADGEPVKGDS